MVHTEEFPLFVTTNVHSDYVDSVKWLGDLLLTKSTKGKMLLWGPDSARFKGAPLILHEYSSSDDQIWYIRMDVCVPLNLVAVGSKEGRVYVHSLGAGGTSEDAGDLKGKQTKLPTSIPVVLQHPKYVLVIRVILHVRTNTSRCVGVSRQCDKSPSATMLGTSCTAAITE